MLTIELGRKATQPPHLVPQMAPVDLETGDEYNHGERECSDDPPARGEPSEERRRTGADQQRERDRQTPDEAGLHQYHREQRPRAPEHHGPGEWGALPAQIPERDG